MRNQHKDAGAHTAGCGMSECFVYDPGVSCLLPASVKLQQANLLACVFGKILKVTEVYC